MLQTFMFSRGGEMERSLVPRIASDEARARPPEGAAQSISPTICGDCRVTTPPCRKCMCVLRRVCSRHEARRELLQHDVAIDVIKRTVSDYDEAQHSALLVAHYGFDLIPHLLALVAQQYVQAKFAEKSYVL